METRITTAQDNKVRPVSRIAILALPYVVPHWLTEDLGREPAVSVVLLATLEEALQTFRTAPVNLLFVQLSLLDSDAGVDPALRLLQEAARDAGTHLKIVLLADSASDDRLLQAFYANVTDFLELPLDTAGIRRFTAGKAVPGSQSSPVDEVPVRGAV